MIANNGPADRCRLRSSISVELDPRVARKVLALPRIAGVESAILESGSSRLPLRICATPGIPRA